MSNRHLPAGQNIQGGVGGVPGVDMAGGPGGPRRRQQPQTFVPQHYHQQAMAPMYANYMPYAPQHQYYGMPLQYQNGGMPSPAYMPYQNYARSPPAMHQQHQQQQQQQQHQQQHQQHHQHQQQHQHQHQHQYVPMTGVTVPPSYPRAAPQSPALSAPYQPPVPAPPIPPHTPSSTQSSQQPQPPTPSTPSTQAPPTPAAPTPEPLPVDVKAAPFRPPLPWLSRPDVDFPIRTTKLRRRRKLLDGDSQAVSLPSQQQDAPAEPATSTAPETKSQDAHVSRAPSEVESVAPQADQQLTSTVTTPESTVHPTIAGKPANRSVAGAAPTPAVPVLPKAAAKDAKAPKAAEETAAQPPVTTNGAPSEAGSVASEAPAPVKAAPSSWAKLFTKANAAATDKTGVDGATSDGGAVNGHGADGATRGANGSPSSFSKANSNSVAEAIYSYHVGGSERVSFLEPRGLINTGNMCYMNSVLQVLMFCIPFYDFLNQVGQKAVHSFKSETPLVDAMIMFMHEYKSIKSAPSVESLRRALKSEELERYGEPFTPEFVYDAIRQLSRFDSMRRGHQQDAEEFLGFLLQVLDDECTSVMGSSLFSGSSGSSDHQDAADPTGDWLEVGRKQRAAVTRSAGSNTSTPITKIFGGLLRSEFRVPGLKDSITTEPYQPLQLDIGSPDVRNVVDALRGLTRPERMQGNFNSPRGNDVTATKQVFIESLPPVLILHLKRFQFDAEGNGTVKIWKKVGYPLELEIPREALSRQKRQTLGEGAMPKYKLISVVYHHGKNASGGHYTADVRRQDGREWIRLDDTVIRRVRSEDVAEGGEEEDIKETRRDNPAPGGSGNRFGAMMDEEGGDDDGWKQMTTTAGGNKKWSNVVDGSNNSGAKKQVKESIKDNKVAYMLFYQRV